jgi:hypothetical protein
MKEALEKLEEVGTAKTEEVDQEDQVMKPDDAIN